MAAKWEQQSAPSGAPYLDWLNGPGAAFAPGAQKGVKIGRFIQGDPAKLKDPDPAGAGNAARVGDLRLTENPGGAFSYPAPLRPEAYGDGPVDVAFGDPEFQASDETEAIVAIIDDGVNVAHQRFVDKAKNTRVDFAWAQDAPLHGDVPFGRELTAADINRARQGRSPAAALRELKLDGGSRPGESTLTVRASHGTHVADLAAGYAEGEAGFDEAHKRRIIIVSLPFFVSQDTSGALFAPFVAAALDYVMDRAGRIAPKGKKTPLVINFSYASSAGPHDGTGLLERIVKERIDKSPGNLDVDIVLPAGNRYQARGYARLEDGATARWRVPPGDATPNFAEIWFDEGVGAGAVTVKPPGAPAQTVAAGRAFELTDGASVLARVSLAADAANGRLRALIATVPTAPKNLSPRAPSGAWEVEVAGGDADGWVQRDEAPYNRRPGAVQSYWDDTKYRRFDRTGRPKITDDKTSYVKRQKSFSGMASLNNTKVWIAGGFDEATGEIADYSATKGGKRGALAVSDRSRARRGVFGAATLSGGGAVFNGTSVAAPQVARMVVETRIAENAVASGGLPDAGPARGDEVFAIASKSHTSLRTAPAKAPGKPERAKEPRVGQRVNRRKRRKVE